MITFLAPNKGPQSELEVTAIVNDAITAWASEAHRSTVLHPSDLEKLSRIVESRVEFLVSSLYRLVALEELDADPTILAGFSASELREDELAELVHRWRVDRFGAADDPDKDWDPLPTFDLPELVDFLAWAFSSPDEQPAPAAEEVAG